MVGRCEDLYGGLGGIVGTDYHAELFEEASLFEEYRSVGSPNCALRLTIACGV
jgi:hypothetical protein